MIAKNDAELGVNSLCSQQPEQSFCHLIECYPLKYSDQARFHFDHRVQRMHHNSEYASLLKHNSSATAALQERLGREEGRGVTNYLSSQCPATITQPENKQ